MSSSYTETGCFNEWLHGMDIFILPLFFYRWFLCWKNAMPRITFLSLYGYFILPYFFSDDFYAEKVQFLELSFYYNELQLGRNMFKRILVFLLQWIVAKAKHVYRILILFTVYHPYNVIVKLTPSGHSFFFLGWSVGIVKWELGFIVFLVWQSDRFIPEKATMDFDLARFMVMRNEKENSDTHTSYPSPSKKHTKRRWKQLYLRMQML